MPAGCTDKTADFTGHTDRIKAGVQGIGNRVAKRSDRPDLGRGAAHRKIF